MQVCTLHRPTVLTNQSSVSIDDDLVDRIFDELGKSYVFDCDPERVQLAQALSANEPQRRRHKRKVGKSEAFFSLLQFTRIANT